MCRNFFECGPFSETRRGKENESLYGVWLHPWRVLDGKDDPPLLMLRMIIMGTMPGAADPAAEDDAGLSVVN